MNKFIENRYLIEKEKWNELVEMSKLNNCRPSTIIEGIMCEIISKWDNSNENIYVLSNEEQSKNKKISWNTKDVMEDNWKIDFYGIERAEECDIREDEDIKIIFSFERKYNNWKEIERISNYIIFDIKDESIEIIWNINKEKYPHTYESMQAMFRELLESYKLNISSKILCDLLPQSQMIVRSNVNNTENFRKVKLLQEDFFENAKKRPEDIALIWGHQKRESMTYKQLCENVLIVAKQLQDAGITYGNNVAVTLNKGYKQIIAVLAILTAGACYVPIGVKLPEKRRNLICSSANINYLVTDSSSAKAFKVDQTVKILNIDNADRNKKLESFVPVSPKSKAYIIFTSGTSGKPKGVIVSHQAARNTIDDVIERFHITSKDRGISISELDFDLSVFDIFGMLTAGGSIFVLDEKDKKEAVNWGKYIENYRITIWNSVPTFFEMLLAAYEKNKKISSLHVVLLSGDWVRPKLFKALRDKTETCRFIALGGATEAGIWSNFYEVDRIEESWNSIPYGNPLANQSFCIIDQYGRECPDFVTGEIYIGGMSLAEGYANQEKLTNERFVIRNGKRWYRTGDLGRYWANGIIEFLGRSDEQVKINGFRVELEEISRTLEKFKGVKKAVTVKVSEGEKTYLAAAVKAKYKYDKKYNIREYMNSDEEKVQKVVKKQTDLTSVFINHVLGITDILDEMGEIGLQDFYTKLKISEDMYNTIELWINWLDCLGYISFKKGKILKGSRYYDFKYSEMSMEAKKLCEKKELFKQILTGKKAELELLEDDTFSPEKMSSQEEGIIKGIEVIAEKIRKICSMSETPVRIAMLGTRSGIIAENLLLKLLDIPCEWTFFDHASSMVERAKERLKKYGNNEVITLSQVYVENNFRHNFDIVVALNSLHTYEDIEQGLFLISSLMSQKGTVFSLDLREIPPVSLLNAAILEDGYAKYGKNNRPLPRNPMMTGKQWCEAFNSKGFLEVNCMPISGTLFELVVSHGLEDSALLTEEKLLDFSAESLPNYMIPKKIAIVYEIPLNKNGKIDTKAISEYFSKKKNDVKDEDLKTTMEIEIADIWKEILGIQSVGGKQNFFEIGGDSLLATHFISVVKEKYGVELSMKEIFEKPTLCDIANSVEKEIDESAYNNEEMEYGEI